MTFLTVRFIVVHNLLNISLLASIQRWMEGSKIYEKCIQLLKIHQPKKKDFKAVLSREIISPSLSLWFQWQGTKPTDPSSSLFPPIQSPVLLFQTLTLVKARVNTCLSHFYTTSLCAPQIQALIPRRKQIPVHGTNSH